MKVPRKLVPLSVGFVLSGLFASVSVLAAQPAPGGSTLPRGVQHLPSYMVVAANLENADYLACVKAHAKFPADRNIVRNVSAALDCQASKN